MWVGKQTVQAMNLMFVCREIGPVTVIVLVVLHLARNYPRAVQHKTKLNMSTESEYFIKISKYSGRKVMLLTNFTYDMH